MYDDTVQTNVVFDALVGDLSPMKAANGKEHESQHNYNVSSFGCDKAFLG